MPPTVTPTGCSCPFVGANGPMLVTLQTTRLPHSGRPYDADIAALHPQPPPPKNHRLPRARSSPSPVARPHLTRPGFRRPRPSGARRRGTLRPRTGHSGRRSLQEAITRQVLGEGAAGRPTAVSDPRWGMVCVRLISERGGQRRVKRHGRVGRPRRKPGSAQVERRVRHPGRKRHPDRLVFQGTLFVLHTGIVWEHLPQELGFGSGASTI